MSAVPVDKSPERMLGSVLRRVGLETGAGPAASLQLPFQKNTPRLSRQLSDSLKLGVHFGMALILLTPDIVADGGDIIFPETLWVVLAPPVLQAVDNRPANRGTFGT